MGPAAANREVHRLLTEGEKVTMKDERTSKQTPRALRVIDWERPGENDFLAVQQFAVMGPLCKCVPDVMLFVNGLPWVVIELKRPGVPVRQAFDENLTSYKHPQNGVPTRPHDGQVFLRFDPNGKTSVENFVKIANIVRKTERKRRGLPT